MGRQIWERKTMSQSVGYIHYKEKSDERGKWKYDAEGNAGVKIQK